MYRMPAEFIKQKNTLFWFITLEHVLSVFAGYLLAQAAGGSTLVIVVCVALGLAATTVKVQGMTLYRFAPLAFSYAVRRLTRDGKTGVELEADAEPGMPDTSVTLLDEDGRPIFFEES